MAEAHRCPARSTHFCFVADRAVSARLPLSIFARSEQKRVRSMLDRGAAELDDDPCGGGRAALRCR